MTDLKAATPDTTLSDTGFLFGADSQAASSPSVYSVSTVVAGLLASTAFGAATITPAGVNAAAYRAQPGIITTDATTSRTLSAGDNGKVLYFTSGSAITLTTATGLGAGFSCTIIQGGAGQITVAQGASTTLVVYDSRVKTSGQYAMASIFCPVANTFILAGNTSA